MNGITFITVLALLCGVAAHVLKQLIAARRNQAGLNMRSYCLTHWPEGVLALVSAAVLYLGLPEIAAMFPDLSKALGVGSEQSVLSSFVVGYMANSLADFLGGRARSIAGAQS
jgi:hypothetical protein